MLSTRRDLPLPAPRREHSIASLSRCTDRADRPSGTVLFDQDGGEIRRVVVLSVTDARALRSLLAQARQTRLMGPPVDDAVALLDRLIEVRP